MSSVRLTQKNKFVTLADKAERRIDLVLRKGIIDIQRTAVMEVVLNAFDTGHLAASIQQAKTGVLTYEAYTITDYAGYVHDGTEKMRARPFFQWAYDAHIEKIYRAMGQVLDGFGGI